MNDARDPIPALKQQLARALLDRLDPYGQCIIARWLRVDQPRASNLQLGRVDRFSLQQLVRFVARVEGEVTISVTWTTPTACINRRWRPVRAAEHRPRALHRSARQG